MCVEFIEIKFYCFYVDLYVMNEEISLVAIEKPKVDANATNSLRCDRILDKLFSASSYYEFHEDVLLAQVDAQKHFLSYGLKENRRAFRRDVKMKKVLFVDGIGNATTVYRIYNFVNALSMNGVESKVVTNPYLSGNYHEIINYNLVVLVRVAWSEHSRMYVKFAKSMGVPVVADFDDIVFDPDIVNASNIDGINGFEVDQMMDYLEGVYRYHQTAMLSDYATGSTDYIVSALARLGKPAFKVRNALETGFYSSAMAWLHLDETIRSKVVATPKIITYLSGSSTHQKDFRQASSAIVKVMEDFDFVEFHVYGDLDLSEFPDFEHLTQRVRQFPRLPYEEYFAQLPGILLKSYVCIAPLDTDSEFCQGKSELKFFEAGAFGVPVLASKTVTFERAIDHGESGILCETVDEWYQGFEKFIVDKEFYRKVSIGARKCSLGNYGIGSLYLELEHVYEQFLSRSEDRKKITWLVPGPIPSESGGHNSILLAAKGMISRGYDVRIYLTCGKEGLASSYDAIVHKFGSLLGIKLYPNVEDFGETDVAIATHYTTAIVLHRNKDRAKHSFYFVQDFEPSFSPIGTDHLQANATYSFGFNHVTIGKWLGEQVSKYSSNVQSIDFWIDRDFYYLDRTIVKRKSLVTFFARPSMPRRCYELGIAALNEIHKANGDVEIALYGERSFPSENIQFPFKDMGVLTKHQLRLLYNESSIVLAFSTTNPSIATFEIMACGTPVVDLDVCDAKSRHFGYPAVLAKPFSVDISDVVVELLSDQERLKALAVASLEFSKGLPNPSHSVDKMVDFIDCVVSDGE